jgi:hypothetical protein
MATKPAKKLTLKQRKLLKATAEGKSRQEAGEIAGFSKKSAATQASMELKKPEVAEAWNQLLDRICPDPLLANTYLDAIQATKVISANVIAPNGEGMADAHSMTKDFIEVPDYPTRLKTADSVAKLKGYLIERVQHDASEAVMAAVAQRMSDGEADPRSEDR